MSRQDRSRHGWLLVVLVVWLSGYVSPGPSARAHVLADPLPTEVVPTPVPSLPPRFDAVRHGQPLYGINWPWDHYGGDFGFNRWGYRGMANQGPAGWRRETQEAHNQAARRLFWAERAGADHCLGVQVRLAGGTLNDDSSALVFTRFDEPAAQPVDATVNLTNQTVTARIYLPAAIAGPASARSGVVLFFQDVNYRWAQTEWMNITTTDTWITISVPGNALPSNPSSDPLFNRSQVRSIGVKVGASGGATGFVYNGPFFVDEVSVSVSPDIRFDFSIPDTRTEQELKDFAGLKAVDIAGLKVYAVRWWLLADGRAGLLFDSNGFVTGVDVRLLDDIREMLRLAKSANVYLMPVLLDFFFGADPVVVDGVQLGGRADLINVPAKRQSLFDALTIIFDELADSNEVLAIDLMNEPEWLLVNHPPEFTLTPGTRPTQIQPGGAVSLETMRTFLSGVIERHKQRRKPGKHPLLTVGSARLQWAGLWSALQLDMTQFHLWNGPGQLDDGLMVPVPPPASGPVILGEFSTLAGLPQPRCDAIRSGLTNGYTGAFPWAYRAKDTESQRTLGAETRNCLTSLPRFTFTDDPIGAGSVVKAVHISELRISVDTLRSSCGLLPYGFTTPMLTRGQTPIQAMHFTEPRTALNEYYDCRSLVRPTYPLPEPGAGGMILRRHLTETRSAALTSK